MMDMYEKIVALHELGFEKAEIDEFDDEYIDRVITLRDLGYSKNEIETILE